MPADAAVSYVARGSLKKNLPYDRIFGALAAKEDTQNRQPGARNHANLYDFIADINQKEALGNRKTVVRKGTKLSKTDKEYQSKQPMHKVTDGHAPHVQSYKTELMHRERKIREHIQDEFHQLDDHKALMELAEARAI